MIKLPERLSLTYLFSGVRTYLIFTCCVFFFSFVVAAHAQDSVNPLKPADRSSPRATLKAFLEKCDAIGDSMAREYLPAPSRAGFDKLQFMINDVLGFLDLSEIPPASRGKFGRATAIALYETLSRIQLPPYDEIPDASQWYQTAGTTTTHWVIPDTEIALVRVTTGPREGQFIFSQETVSSARNYFGRVRSLPYTRNLPLKNIAGVVTDAGGWMIPSRWILELPTWLHVNIFGQAAWKFIALVLLLGLFALFFWVTYCLLRRGSSRHLLRKALAQIVLPACLLLAVLTIEYLALYQINLTGEVANFFGMATAMLEYMAGAWLSWRIASVVAEAIIASPRIAAPQSIDAHLIRICARLLGIVGVAFLLGIGADRLGIPVYGIVAGLGVGGLAIALAAQPTIENLIGGLNLFADKPVRVGELCKYGDAIGTVEAVGIRSTRIRGIDRTLTTIPNAVLAKMSIINFARRDRMLLKADIGLRYETQPEQLRYVLAKLRELLLAHPKVTPEPSRVRLIGFGASSINLEVFAYVDTKDWNDFLAIQEDINLRMIDIVSASGSGFAFPSQTIYFARDSGLDSEKSLAAIAEVQQWRDSQNLPFPEFDVEFRKMHRDTLNYPPEGSMDEDKKTEPSS